MINITHTSDLHGSCMGLLDSLSVADMWLDTGDFFPNLTRGVATSENRYQQWWFDAYRLGERLVKALDGRPLVSIGGNHDYVSLTGLVIEAGGVAFDLSNGPVNVCGIQFSGFRDVPWLAGEWNGESHDLSGVIDVAFDADPTVLVTHAPPGGILDKDRVGAGGYGIASLTTALAYRQHRISHHFFGHAHNSGGQVEDQMGIRFINGAGNCRLHRVV